MKLKLIIGLFAASMLCSCASEEPVAPAEQPQQEQSSIIRSKEDAIKLAISHMTSRTQSRAADYEVDNVEIVRGISSRAENDTLLYIINFAVERGFVIVSAAKTGEDIIAYADESNFTSEEENPSCDFYMEAAKEYVAEQLAAGPTPDSPNLEIIPDPFRPVTTVEKVAPRINLKWGQNYPEGSLCYNGYCGCVQTAMVMTMAYFKYPDYITFTSDDGLAGRNTYLDWDRILKHTQSAQSETSITHSKCTAEEYAHNTLARLCFELCKRNGALFYAGKTESSASFGRMNLQALMDTKTVSNFINFTLSSDIFDFLYNNKTIAIVTGSDSELQMTHEWIMCGGERYTTTSKGVGIDGSDSVIVKTYYYFNWGWNGSKNGYFTAGVFKPDNSVTPSKIKSRGYDFSSGTNLYWVY